MDRLVELRIKGMRTLADVRLPLDGLAVLIGDNGTGKTSIIQACEILHRSTLPGFHRDPHEV